MDLPAVQAKPVFSKFNGDVQNTDLPSLFSDEEFEGALHQREDTGRSVHERWDNAAVIEKPRGTDGLPESTIEQRFPHVAKHLVAMWGSEGCALYLKRLLIPEREGRHGFPLEVLEDLILLDRINAMLFVTRQTTDSVWDA